MYKRVNHKCNKCVNHKCNNKVPQGYDFCSEFCAVYEYTFDFVMREMTRYFIDIK